MRIPLQELLKKYRIVSSAPMRIDCGSTWDLPALALTYKHIKPHTINIAIKQRVHIELHAYSSGKACIESEEFGTEICKENEYPYTSVYKTIFATLSYFNVSGVLVRIRSDLPAKLGFGGSASVIVSLVSALSECLFLLKLRTRISKHDIALLSYSLERAFIQTGMQDHLAATYGGVNRWNWNFDDFKNPYRKEELIKPKDLDQLESRISIAYSLENHDSETITNEWIDSFLCNSSRTQWLDVNRYSHQFALAITKSDWKEAIKNLQHESEARLTSFPSTLTHQTSQLVDVSKKNRCAARFVGAGHGGGIWALGERADILKLIEEWSALSAHNKKIFTVNNKISKKGVLVNAKQM